MKEMLDRKKEQYNLAIRKEHRDRLVAEKRKRMIQAMSADQTLEELQRQLHRQFSETGLKSLTNCISQNGKPPSVQTIRLLFHHLHFLPLPILECLVSITALDRLSPAILSLLLHNVPILLAMLNNSNCIATIQNIIYIIANMATQNAEIKEVLTSSVFFQRINLLAMQNLTNGDFINTVLWMYSNILIKNKRSMKEPQNYTRQFMTKLMNLLKHVNNQQKTVLRLVNLVVLLTKKEDKEYLWAAGLDNIVQFLFSQITADEEKATSNLKLMLTILQQYRQTALVFMEHLKNILRAMLSHEEIYHHFGILEIVLEMATILKDPIIDQQLTNQIGQLWDDNQSVQFVYNLARFLLYVCQTGVQLDQMILLKRLNGLLCYENNDIVDAALKCLTVMLCQTDDTEKLGEMMREVGIVSQLVELEMHENTEIFERVKEILDEVVTYE